MASLTFSREALLAKLAAKSAVAASPVPAPTSSLAPVFQPKYFTSKGFPLNQEQSQAVEYAEKGISFCLIGAAGTGKTTTLREVVLAVSRNIPPGATLAESIILCSFTRRAVANAKRALGDLDSSFCKTIHKSLRYRRFKEEYFDEEGEQKTKYWWGPGITAANPDYAIQLIIIEEASMVGYSDLYRELREAFPEATFIFVGDLNQLKPVFGDSCLGFKLNSIPVVELTEVYRQAMDSPIIAFQHNYTLQSKVPTTKTLEEISLTGKGLLFLPIKRRQENPVDVAHRIFNSWILPQMRNGKFNPDEDIVLCPNNGGVGQVTFNAYIAYELSRTRGEPTWEVDCGIKKLYLSIGDTVQADKRDGKIVDIIRNPEYEGNATLPPSLELDRFGKYHGKREIDLSLLDYAGDHLSGERALKHALKTINGLTPDDPSDAQERRRQASHIISIAWADADEGDEPAQLSAVGEVGGIQLNYAMTVHRSQGSEWRKVILILHSSAGGLLCRESLYTGMTRAREELEVLYSPNTEVGKCDNTLAKCILKASIPGKSWQEKAKHFAGKWEQLTWVDTEDEKHG